MKNYEAFKEEIMMILVNDESLAVRDGKPGYCGEIPCECCDFRPEKLYVCGEAKRNWLNAEYVEMPKLTRREWHLCKALKTRYLARGENGALYLHEEKPHKSGGMWFSPGVIISVKNIMPDGFNFIQWQDEEPWSVEGLLKLEVEE